MLSLVRARPQHCLYIGEHMRSIDRHELAICSGLSPVEAMVESYKDSPAWRWTGINGEGTPVFMFGLGTRLSCDWGTPWLLGTERLYEEWYGLLRISRGEIRKMLAFRENLTNAVWEHNHKTQRWLLWCGFSLGETVTLPNGEQMRRFWMCA